MKLKRRTFLKMGAVAAGSAAAAAAKPAMGSTAAELPDDARGMLYDTTLCIGCKACVTACRQSNNLAPDTENSPVAEGLFDAPIALSGKTKNIIKLYSEPPYRSYMKQQCMHCVDPACVGACMIGAFAKREYGVVTWNGDLCIGCRYCQVACPYGIPKFEWDKANPTIVKCELCRDREGKEFEPACCDVCPRGAVIAGNTKDLLDEAHRRIEANPGKYYEDRVYGEVEGGGTQVLYLSHVPFEKIGLPTLGERAVPELPRSLQHGIYQGFITPAILYAALGVTIWRNRRSGGGEGGHE
jgi:Fe-S-cluster-containing dehydrogenase component